MQPKTNHQPVSSEDSEYISMTRIETSRKSSFATYLFLFSFISSILCTSSTYAQSNSDSILTNPTLPNVVQYALKRQPAVLQSLLDQEITDFQIKSRLADWYPQINFNYLYQHNFKVQVAVINGNPTRLGVNNTSAFQFSASQNIFNRDVLLASRTKGDVRQQALQLTEDTKIGVVTNVSRAFYDLVTTQEQSKVTIQNINRLERTVKDTRAKYEAGVVDKTDYKRATIALNNSIAQKKANDEAQKAKQELLKSLMGYPTTEQLNVVYDSAVLEAEIAIDTLQPLDYNRRIEYRILMTQRRLQESNVQYNKWSYFPTLSANGAYNFNYQSNEFGKLYNQSFPQSFAGLTLSFPIFQGGKRKWNIKQAQWELKRVDLDVVNLKNTINAEYSGALAGYKTALYNFIATRENVALAQEVYDVILLQYNSGIKTYLEVAVAENDLRTAQINYFNALFQVLSNRIEVQRARGEIVP
jgi:outer membrane protein TolC